MVEGFNFLWCSGDQTCYRSTLQNVTNVFLHSRGSEIRLRDIENVYVSAQQFILNIYSGHSDMKLIFTSPQSGAYGIFTCENGSTCEINCLFDNSCIDARLI